MLNFLRPKNKKLRDLVSEHPEVLIHNGTLNCSILDKQGISNEELKEAMREHGVENFTDVKLAILEIDGNISIIAGDNNKSLTQTHHKRRAHKTLGSVN